MENQAKKKMDNEMESLGPFKRACRNTPPVHGESNGKETGKLNGTLDCMGDYKDEYVPYNFTTPTEEQFSSCANQCQGSGIGRICPPSSDGHTLGHFWGGLFEFEEDDGDTVPLK